MAVFISPIAAEQELLELGAKVLSGEIHIDFPHKSLSITDGRLYCKLHGADSGYIMVDPKTNRVKIVYDLTGEFRRNFTPNQNQTEEVYFLLNN